MLEVLCDHRLGNVPKYYLGEKGDGLMLVPDEVRKCVVFICYKSMDGSMKLGGTGFFVGVSSEITDRAFVYLITAKHVIDGIHKRSIDDNILVRINQKNNSSIILNTPYIKWKYHPTENNVDVAVLNWAPEQDIFDYRFLPTNMAATQEVIEKEHIGCGDEVFLTGLFSNHYGKERNIPIIRLGNISSMPEELVQTKELGAIDAYLIEARSIGGLSGSPVFVHVSGIRGGALRLGTEPIYWLGLMHGHFDLTHLEIEDGLSQDNLYNVAINMGIAIVVPVNKILEVLNQPDFISFRKQQDEAERQKKAATPDTTLPNASEQPS
jgi:hypothetical protein